MSQNIKIRFDPEADFLEITLLDGIGCTQETCCDAISKRVDADGNIIGFSVLGVSQLSKLFNKPVLLYELTSDEHL